VRNISCSLTTRQVRAREKFVTRRIGWLDVEVGEELQLCEKCMGRREGEPLVRLAIVVVVNVRREPLRRLLDEPRYGRLELKLEGFPEMSRQQFVEFFIASHKKCKPATIVTRIAWRYRAR